MGKRKAPRGGGAASQRGGHGAKRHRGSASAKAAMTETLYTLQDVILVLGDGDFTFSQALVAHRGGGRNLFATSYDSEPKVKAKYSNATDCIAAVRAAGAVVFHGVDATKLHTLPRRSSGAKVTNVPPFFKFIIFNFPHTGQQRVHINRALLVEFFESARNKLVKAGEVHITLKNRPPYSNWLVEDQAKAGGFVLKERRRFNVRNFPGYNHRTTDPQAKAFEAELCTTYVFVVNRSKYPFEATAAAQRELQSAIKEDSNTVATPAARDDASGDDDEEEAREELADRVDTPATKTPSKNAKRKRSKRRHVAELAAPAAALPAAPLANEKTRKADLARLWRPLHRR